MEEAVQQYIVPARTYLVTGAAGFIGSHLTEALLAAGHRVVGVDNFDPYYSEAIKRKNLTGALAHPGFELFQGDICDPLFLQRVMMGRNIHTIFHLAARAGVRQSINDPAEYIRVNMNGTQNVLDAARNNGIGRMVFASSSSVYGEASAVPFVEGAPTDRPVSPYAATKKAGELLCHSWHHLYGIEIACLRLFTVYGPRQRPDMAIHRFVRCMFEGDPVPMYGDGSTVRDYTYVADAVAGFISVAEKFSGFRIVNIGESRTTSLRDLIDVIASAVGCEPRLAMHSGQQGDVPFTHADISAARELGYDPSMPVREGIGLFVEWYRREHVPASAGRGMETSPAA